MLKENVHLKLEAQVADILKEQLRYVPAGFVRKASLTKELVEAAREYRNEGVSQVGLECIKAQMNIPTRKEVMRECSIMEKQNPTFLDREDDRPVSVHQAKWIQDISNVLGLVFTGETYNEAYLWIATWDASAKGELSLPITDVQRQQIRQIRKTLGIPFTGTCRIHAERFIHLYYYLAVQHAVGE